MTRKRKLTKRQRQEQRRAAMERVRQERGWQPPPPPARQDELLDDMLPLFPEIADPSSPLPSIEPVLMTLVGSSDLVDEPEFEDIIIDPMLCMATFVQTAEEMGHDPDDLLELSEEEREDVQVGILAEIIKQLLTVDLRQQVRDGLDRYHLRLKQAGDRQEVARAAMLLSFLDKDASGEMWSMIGLVQAIFHRSVYIGFEMAESSVLAMEAKEADDDPVTLVEKLAQSSVGRRAEAMLKRVPGLGKFLAKQADTTWEEGQHAVFMGELYLELYSEEELVVGLELFRQTLGDLVEGARAQGREVALSEDRAKEFVSRADAYVVEILTPERLDQLRDRLGELLRERVVEEKWQPFVFMLRQYMAEPDAAENERPFLVSAFLGELRHVGEALEEEWEKSKEDA